MGKLMRQLLCADYVTLKFSGGTTNQTYHMNKHHTGKYALPFQSDARRNEIFTKILQIASDIIVRTKAEHDAYHAPVGDSGQSELPPLSQLTKQLCPSQ
ncbi:hypothetical protein CHS0354_005366 [Potamilus streckersoni]|uniref:Uncharacterized protein n=1 Tax=Potamilus streckersoni TaxID=2493646 RepID=A0AAE0VWT6_9BIVA|nr:hypothetical protein CHS0354_005366 [Potamilus streckersoni]